MMFSTSASVTGLPPGQMPRLRKNLLSWDQLSRLTLRELPFWNPCMEMSASYVREYIWATSTPLAKSRRGFLTGSARSRLWTHLSTSLCSDRLACVAGPPAGAAIFWPAGCWRAWLPPWLSGRGAGVRELVAAARLAPPAEPPPSRRQLPFSRREIRRKRRAAGEAHVPGPAPPPDEGSQFVDGPTPRLRLLLRLRCGWPTWRAGLRMPRLQPSRCPVWLAGASAGRCACAGARTRARVRLRVGGNTQPSML
mmetsp:Transcript_5478/g.23179  ORF Transcript_5478/g.23179 Transcript_5478/m.23179 type:complete len:252 (+) Transcript_5478:440-1195(+)